MKKILLSLLVFLVNNTYATTADFGFVWEINLPLGNQIYPSYAWANSVRDQKSTIVSNLLAVANKDFIGDNEGMIGIKLTNLTVKSHTIKIVVECDDIMRTTTMETFIANTSTKVNIFPEIDYKWELLQNNKQPRPINIKITVWDNGKKQETKSQKVILHSINDCPYTYINRQNELIDLNYMYAAYVNENNPIINDQILPTIFSQNTIKTVTGYQGTNKDVLKQVFATWHLFKKNGTTYSSLNSAVVGDMNALPYVRHQYVRTLEDALSSKQANCVDGTVAMASVLYRMGIKPIIVTTPSHCFLGYFVDNQETNLFFLETTALGAEFPEEVLEQVAKFDIFDPELDAIDRVSYRSFLAVTLLGKNNYEKDQDKFNAYGIIDELQIITDENKFELIDKLQYQMYLVAKYRQQGLLSIYK